MDLSDPLYQKLLFCSPSRVEEEIASGFEERGNTNALISYHIQKRLHEDVFMHPAYLRERRQGVKTRFRRIQSLAFDGVYPPLETFDNLAADIEGYKGHIYENMCQTIATIQDLIKHEENRWHLLGEEPGMTRLLQGNVAADTLAKELGGRIVIFGSARRKIGSPEYQAAEWLTRTLVHGLTDITGKSEHVLTGAGPSFMEAGSKGAMEGRLDALRDFINNLRDTNVTKDELEARIWKFRRQLHSIGMRIALPFEAGWNPFLQLNLTLKHFAPRKHGLIAGAVGRSVDAPGRMKEHIAPELRHPAFFIFTPGLGTLDELYEVLCLMQCGKMPRTPVFVVGPDARSVIEPAMQTMADDLGTITISEEDPSKDDTKLVIYCRDEIDAMERYLKYYGLPTPPKIQEAIHTWKPLLTGKKLDFNGGH